MQYLTYHKNERHIKVDPQRQNINLFENVS